MSIYVIKEDAQHPIPRPVKKHKTTYCIVMLPGNHIVERGSTNGRSISVDLDPGKYRIVVSQFIVTGEGTATLTKWRKDFYHDLGDTDEEAEIRFTRLKDAPLRFTRGIMTSDGLRYHCQLPGCSQESTSRTAAILHEAEHSGIDLLREPVHPAAIPPPTINMAAAEAQTLAERQAQINRLREASRE